MEFLNLLASDVGISLYGPTYNISLNWIGNLIRSLISAVGSVGVGIILFSIILRLVVMPFDVYQRINMRKQNIKMKENQEKMEKLQKQYANNKEMYNQKVMEMYKESGMSMFSSCLPLILSMVIFIVAINAFNAYAQYANVYNYNTMVNAYNEKITEYTVDLDSAEYSYETLTEGETTYHYVVAKEEGKDIYFRVLVADSQQESIANATPDELKAYVSAYTGDGKGYYIDVEKAYENADIKKYADDAVAKALEETPDLSADNQEKTKKDAIKGYYTEMGQNAVLEAYNTKVLSNTSFLWIKNIWATDASYKHPVLGYNDFKQEVERENFSVNGNDKSFNSTMAISNAYDKEAYDTVTKKLDVQKSQANGYYILIALSIGTILLQQWISNRSQKEQQKYSSVDGQAGSQQKMMMVIMTAMFAIFAFMYSSAFSIYMIMSNILSLLSTLIINKLVDIVQTKKEEKAMQKKYNKRFPGRIAPGEKKDKNNK